ncbi:hypothetical protein [Noviherbaspirillum massiliense]|uniref:hypothetical protein n=1 Tax=Noviherbaspirillum massiliense TaxID=1465823 RepID=UPI0002E97A04|nr:hypothetical protein [Noviherbaspirillum massiliense]
MKAILSLLACLALAACTLPRALPETTDLKADPSEVVVIGKMELIPPIDSEYEQRSHWNVIGEKRMLTRVWMSTGGEFQPVNTANMDFGDFQDSLEAQWGVPFMVKVKRQRTYLNGGVFHLDVGDNAKLWFPGGLYFDVPKDAKAVYIGTLRYYRNDFNAITSVEVVDERKDIAAALKTGGSPSEVRTSLLKRIR